MTSSIQLSGRDYDGELTRFRAFFPDTTGANFDAQSTNLDDLQTAVNAVCAGAFNGKVLKGVDVPVAGQSANKAAQREQKWLVSYTDNVNPIGDGSFEIGMADTQYLADGGSGNMDVSQAPGSALVAEIETSCVSRLGNAITVNSIKLVGRNI